MDMISPFQYSLVYNAFSFTFATMAAATLNSRNMLIRDELMAEGSIDQAVIHVREVIRRAMGMWFGARAGWKPPGKLGFCV